MKIGNAIAITLFFVVGSQAYANAETLSGRVVAVLDGDTVAILSPTTLRETRVRLAAIDAPEISHGAHKPGQPFGQAAKHLLSDICFGKVAMAEVTSVDKYGRTVAFLSCDGVDANSEMVKNGMAWVYRQYLPSGAAGQALIDYERLAKQRHAGLWAEAATPPWDFRHGG